MSILSRFTLWLRALFRRRRVESELERELRLHLELETEENVRRGMTPAEARRRALVAFGGVEQTKEAVRDERETRWLDELLADVRYSLRGFRRQPSFTATAALLLALGIGANVAVFSVVHRLILHPLPFRDGNRMVELEATAGGGATFPGVRQEFVDVWRARAREVVDITVIDERSYTIGDTAQSPERAWGAAIPPGALAFAESHLALGRDIAAADTISNAPRVAILSDGLWQRLFGASRSVVGRTILLDGTPHTIIGVAPPNFRLPFIDGRAVFTALPAAAGRDRLITAVAKLRAHEDVSAANRELAAIFASIPRAKSSIDDPPRVLRAVDQLGRLFRQIVETLFGAVGFVLLIACANVANLVLARAWSRQREFAVRGAMGAGAGRLVRQVFTESILLAIIAGAMSLGVAALALRLMRAAQPPHSTELNGAGLTGPVLVWSLLIAVIAGLLFGLAPALFLARRDSAEVLKAGTRTATGSRAARHFRSALVVLEVALSVVLLIGSGLLIRTLVAMQRMDFGIETHNLAAVSLRLTDKRLTLEARRDALHTVLDRVRAIPGIEQATLGERLPPDDIGGMSAIEIEGRTVGAVDSLSSFTLNGGAADFFSVLGMHFVEGHGYADDPTPTEAQQSSEVVIGERFAKRFWANGGAVGAHIRPFANLPWVTVVGVVRDIRTPGDERRPRRPQLYMVMPASTSHPFVLFRSHMPLAQIVPPITKAIHEANPLIGIGSAATADGQFMHYLALHRFTLKLLGAFAGLALLLAVVGLHSVVAYSVTQRSREIGVRMALGAATTRVIGLVVRQAMGLALIGVAIGCAAGALASRALRSMLYGVGTTDPLTVAGVAMVLVLGALIAAYAPARHAALVNPMDALRSD
jgi:putative ABC transport system permease protein